MKERTTRRAISKNSWIRNVPIAALNSGILKAATSLGIFRAEEALQKAQWKSSSLWLTCRGNTTRLPPIGLLPKTLTRIAALVNLRTRLIGTKECWTNYLMHLIQERAEWFTTKVRRAWRKKGSAWNTTQSWIHSLGLFSLDSPSPLLMLAKPWKVFHLSLISPVEDITATRVESLFRDNLLLRSSIRATCNRRARMWYSLIKEDSRGQARRQP